MWIHISIKVPLSHSKHLRHEELKRKWIEVVSRRSSWVCFYLPKFIYLIIIYCPSPSAQLRQVSYYFSTPHRGFADPTIRQS